MSTWIALADKCHEHIVEAAKAQIECMKITDTPLKLGAQVSVQALLDSEHDYVVATLTIESHDTYHQHVHKVDSSHESSSAESVRG